MTTPRETLQHIFGTEPDENLLMVKTLNNTTMLLKYKVGKTLLRSVISCLKYKVNYGFRTGEGTCDMDSISLRYEGRVIDKQNSMLEDIGIINPVELVQMNFDGLVKDKRTSDNIVKQCRRRIRRKGGAAIFIKTLVGSTTKLIVPKDINGLELKYFIQDSDKIPIDQSRIIFGGKQLENTTKLIDYSAHGNIDNGIVHLVLRLSGGMFHEISGRDGEYRPLTSVSEIIYTVDPIKTK